MDHNWKKFKVKVRIKNPYLYLFLKSKGKVNHFQINKKIYDELKDSECFDKNFYLKKYPSIKKSGMDPLFHYVIFGQREGRIPSEKFEKIYKILKSFEYFDEEYYLKNNPNIKKSGLDPLLHYIFYGYRKGKLPSYKFEKIYTAVKDSGFFNEEYYLKNNPNIKKSGLDPLLHYIFYGYREGKLPSVKFDGNYYLELHKDVKKSGYNPLIHYVLYGKNSGRIIKSMAEDFKFIEYSGIEIDNILSAFKSKIKIIIYIYNDFENTEACITSILENTKIDFELILIDDFSTDKRINTLLNKLMSLKNLTIVKNDKKLGFLKSVNLEIKNSVADILLIKSNFVVTTRWLQKLVVAAYSDDKIATVSPITISPKFISDIISKSIKLQQMNPKYIVYLLETISEYPKPEIIYPDESCLYIKREIVNEIGLLKEINDPNESFKDFYQKILDKGWKNIIDDSTYVYDNIGNDTDENKIEISSLIIQRIVRNIKIRSEELDFTIPKKKVLIVLHENIYGLTGGTGQTTKDILEKIGKEFECYILTPSGRNLLLWKKEENQLERLKSWSIKSKWSATEFYNDEYKNIYFKILIALKIDLVHIQHLIRHTRDLPMVANTLGIPIILSFHDFYYVCPSINLLNNNNHYCEVQCTQQTSQCKYPVQIFDELPILKDFINIWRKESSDLIEKCNAFTAPTQSTMDLYISIYPELKNKKYKLIEHGRDIKKTKANFELPSENKPIKVLVPGIIKNHKGQDLIKEIKKIDHQNRIEFHFMGIIYDDLIENGIYHGKYKNEDFCEYVHKIKPSFVGIFSICPETYCHTLTEAWSCGIPVLTTKMGALKERIVKNGGGWFLDHKSPLKAYGEIIRISSSAEEYLKVAERVSKIKLKNATEMVNEYEQLYREL